MRQTISAIVSSTETLQSVLGASVGRLAGSMNTLPDLRLISSFRIFDFTRRLRYNCNGTITENRLKMMLSVSNSHTFC